MQALIFYPFLHDTYQKHVSRDIYTRDIYTNTAYHDKHVPAPVPFVLEIMKVMLISLEKCSIITLMEFMRAPG